MANISLSSLFTNKVRKFGVADSTRYQNAFVDAVNMTYADFNAEVFQAETLSYLDDYTDVTGGAEGPDMKYYTYFSSAVEYYLQEGGEWAIEPEERNLERKWRLRDLPKARELYRSGLTYTNPLGITDS